MSYRRLTIRRGLPLRSALAVAVLGWAACGDTKSESPTTTPAVASTPDDGVEDGPRVGYDVRRLRPRNEEKLEAMFDRMHREAASEGKKVAVLFSAGWCEPCQRLELEFGNEHPREDIGHIRIVEVKEEDWLAVTRMNEVNTLRRRWFAPLNTYPLFIVLDEEGEKVEEMKEAVERLEAAGMEPTIPNWFRSVRG